MRVAPPLLQLMLTIGVGIVIAHDAESARGVAPRAAHRSGRESLDSSGSCHPPKAAACCQGKEFLRLPVDSSSTWMTCPLRSVGVPHFFTTTRQCAPAQRISAFGLAGLPLVPFPLAPPAGSQVPYQSPV